MNWIEKILVSLPVIFIIIRFINDSKIRDKETLNKKK